MFIQASLMILESVRDMFTERSAFEAGLGNPLSHTIGGFLFILFLALNMRKNNFNKSWYLCINVTLIQQRQQAE